MLNLAGDGTTGGWGCFAARYRMHSAICAWFPPVGLGFSFAAGQSVGESLDFAQQSIDLRQERFGFRAGKGSPLRLHERGL